MRSVFLFFFFQAEDGIRDTSVPGVQTCALPILHYFWHYVANRMLTLLSDIFTNLKLTDMETCYKVFRREVLAGVEVKSNRFGFEPEITAKIAKHKWRIYEVPISYAGRTYEEGKKITWKDGIQALWCIIRYKFTD